MKKLLLTITAGLIITGTCVWLAGCKKEATTKAESTEIKAKNWELDHQAVEKRIKNFIGSTKSLSKTDSNVAIDSALWNVEAALNFTYCSGVPALLGVEKDTLVQTFVPVAAGMLSANAVAQWYLDLTVYIDQFLNKISAEQGRIKLVDVENITKAGDAEITFKVSIFYGFEMNAKAEQACSFGPSDNWYWGFKLGRADGAYLNQLDATDQLEYAMNSCPENTGQPVTPGDDYYFTGIESFYINYWDLFNYRTPGDPNPTNNLHDYLVFYKKKTSGLTYWSKILKYAAPYDEMNFYLQGIKTIKTNTVDIYFEESGRVFAFIIIGYGASPSNNPSEIWHTLDYRYGAKHPGVNPN